MYLNSLWDYVSWLLATGAKIILTLILAELILIVVGVIVLTAKAMVSAGKKEREEDGSKKGE